LLMKNGLRFFLIFILFIRGAEAIGSNGKFMREVRTYMSYTWPIDPAKIIILPDMDLSYALASTLVEWDSSKQKVSGLASHWEPKGDTTYKFFLRDGLKWSDGKPVTSEDVRRSLERGMKAYPDDWRSLIKIVKSITCPAPNIIEFNLTTPVDKSNLLGKFTEPNYGIVKVTPAGTVDTSVTVGAFFLSSASKNELTLEPNPHYIHDPKVLAKKIIVRRMQVGENPQDILLKDPWPNLIQLPSLLPKKTFDEYQKTKYTFWNRPTDRAFLFQLGRRLYNEDGKNLFRFLNTKIERKNLGNGLVGFGTTSQLFPNAYQLYDSKFNISSVKKASLPAAFKNRPLEILLSPERVSPTLKQNIHDEILRITGHAPHIIEIPMSELFPRYWKADYDFYAGTYGLADPDVEGLMSFYFENDFRVIPEIDEHFIDRIDRARKILNEDEKIAAMRTIMTEATYKGHIVPLFHLSTMGIARGEIDLSQVPITDESVTLSKIRFQEGTN
jgi:MarR-like DNA-binding transcriptional regulator SgrR of sgrS sRNA